MKNPLLSVRLYLGILSEPLHEMCDATADDAAAENSSDTSSGTNWLEENPELAANVPWDSDEDIDGFRQFSGRGDLVTPDGQAADFVNPPFSAGFRGLEAQKDPEPEPEPEPEKAARPRFLDRLDRQQQEWDVAPTPEPEPEPELVSVVLRFVAEEGTPEW